MKRSELKQLIREVIEEVGGSSADTIYKRWMASLYDLDTVQNEFMEELSRRIYSGLVRAKIMPQPGTSGTYYTSDQRPRGGPAGSSRNAPTQEVSFDKLKKSGENNIYSVKLSFEENKAIIKVKTWGKQDTVKEDVTKATEISEIIDAITRGMQKLENNK